MKPIRDIADMVRFIKEKEPSRVIVSRELFTSLKFQSSPRAFTPPPDEWLNIEGVRIEALDKREVDFKKGGEWDLTKSDEPRRLDRGSFPPFFITELHRGV